MKKIIWFVLIVAIILLFDISFNFLGDQCAYSGDLTENEKKKENTEINMDNAQKATFGAGCFWGVEAKYRQIKGVISTSVGYTGGETENPEYKAVCSDTTGHAEAVEVIYDPDKVTYAQLLDVFWSGHNPTQFNRQGPDYGSQYRSVIFYHDNNQKLLAENTLAELDKSGQYNRPVVTQIIPAVKFYPAEDYHQQYLEKRGLSSCGFK